MCKWLMAAWKSNPNPALSSLSYFRRGRTGYYLSSLLAIGLEGLWSSLLTSSGLLLTFFICLPSLNNSSSCVGQEGQAHLSACHHHCHIPPSCHLPLPPALACPTCVPATPHTPTHTACTHHHHTPFPPHLPHTTTYYHHPTPYLHTHLPPTPLHTHTCPFALPVLLHLTHLHFATPAHTYTPHLLQHTLCHHQSDRMDGVGSPPISKCSCLYAMLAACHTSLGVGEGRKPLLLPPSPAAGRLLCGHMQTALPFSNSSHGKERGR